MKRWFLFRLLLAFSAGFVGCSEDDNNEQNGITGSQIVINSITVPQVSRGQKNAEASIFGANFSNISSVSIGRWYCGPNHRFAECHGNRCRLFGRTKRNTGTKNNFSKRRNFLRISHPTERIE